MAVGVRLLALSAILLLGLLPACAAEDAEDDAPAEMAEAEAEEEPPAHSEEEWKALQKNIMDSLPDDEEDGKGGGSGDEEDEDSMKRWHVYKSFPFLEYNGFLEEEEGRNSNLHTATMTMDEAKEWCGESENCAGFTHTGGPTEGPIEMFFKDRWALSVDGEELWTSYQKGEKMQSVIDDEEAYAEEHPFNRCEIQTCSG